MATNVKLLRHQGLILQSPYVHTETKFHFDIAGYGAGKTSGLVYALMYTVGKLQGKKDAEGNFARVILASKNLTFLSKTSISNLEQVLRRTNTEYRYDKKNNIITVGTVDIFLIPLENPETIYGYSCFEENTKIVTEYGELKIKDVKEGMRVWTTKGWKRVKHVFNNGKRDCIKVTVGNKEILCTPEHRFIDCFDNEIQAKDLTENITLIKLDTTKSYKPAHLTAKTSSVVGQYTVYDLEVEDVHEYFAEGIRVHNCVASFLDELSELPPDVCMEAIKAVNERTRQTVMEFRDPFIISVSSSQGLDGQYMAMEHFRRNGISYVYIRGETKDNVYLKKSDIDNLYKIYNETERKVYLEGYFLSVKTSLVFSDYDPVKNKLAVDLFDQLEPDDTVYIGQDFNCIEGEVLIDTIKGKVRMKSLKEGDYVLTRKGYKKVLHKVYKGNKIVQEFNNGLVATPDHVAITPEGEIELCKAQKFYYLSKQNTESLKEKRKALMRLLKLKKLYLTEGNITETQKVQSYAHTISGMEKEVCTEIFMNIILERLQKEIISTTKTDIMITDLKHLSLLLNRNMLKCTAKKRVVYEVRKVLQNLQSIILLSREEKSMEEFQKMLGKTEHMTVLLFALIVAKNLKLELKLQSDVQNVNINGIFSERERLIKAWKDTVLYVENLLQEQVQLHIAQNTEVIGKDLNIKERGIQKVYDIEVEDCHEFYANGILVHNCFGNSAVACVVKKGAIIVLKDYDIPDIRRAPEIFRYDFPTQKIVWIPDATATSFYTQFKKELWAKKIKIAYRKSNPLVQDRVFVANKLMYSERMFICPIAKSVEHSLLTHQFDPKTGQPMKGGKGAPDHISDALGYAVYHIMCWVKDLKDLYDVTLGRAKISRVGSLGQEVDADYRLLSPEKLKFEIPDNVDNIAE